MFDLQRPQVMVSRLFSTIGSRRVPKPIRNWQRRLCSNRKALGRGLGALLSSDRAFDLQDNPNEVDIDLIDRNPAQPRAAFDLESLNSLAESVKVHGVVQPLLVRRV